jgi:hypothetical protein
MRNRLIDEYGSYKEMSFTGSNGVWSLVASKSVSDDGSVMLTLDTFKSEKGLFKALQRSEVDHMFENGIIWIGTKTKR